MLYCVLCRVCIQTPVGATLRVFRVLREPTPTTLSLYSSRYPRWAVGLLPGGDRHPPSHRTRHWISIYRPLTLTAFSQSHDELGRSSAPHLFSLVSDSVNLARWRCCNSLCSWRRFPMSSFLGSQRLNTSRITCLILTTLEITCSKLLDFEFASFPLCPAKAGKAAEMTVFKSIINVSCTRPWAVQEPHSVLGIEKALLTV